MEEEREKAKKTASKSSKVQNKSRKTIEVTTLSSDELMEQILAKKKSKSNSSVKKKSSDTTKKTISKSTKSSKINKMNVEISNDELYDLIKNKKKTTKKKVTLDTVKPNESNNVHIDSNDIVDNSSEIVNESSENITEIIDEKSEINEKDNLIITREIVFSEDKLDLNDKKVLEELRDAIKDFDALDDTAEIPKQDESSLLDGEELFANKITREKKHKKKKNNLLFNIKKSVDKIKNNWKVLAGVVILICLVIIFVSIYINIDDSNKSLKLNGIDTKEDVVDVRPQLYDECLTRPLDESDFTEELQLAEQELTSYLEDNYNASVIYEDLGLGFTYSFNSDVVYYAASTIKSLDALYIYTKAAAGELNLDEMIKYTSKYKWSSSKEMSKHKYGDEITLRDLVKYAITVSDNSAHQMLVSYIGRNNLKEFGLSLGAENTLSGGDNFGNISASDAIIYMKELNNFINSNEELGKELQSYFLEADQNDLSIDELNIQAAHKYGEYSYYYHDIGIVYDENPYVIAILSTEGKGDFEAKIKDINKHVYELHRLYNDNRKNICYAEVYGS